MNDAHEDCRRLCVVRFSIPKPLHKVGMCHCGICRRWSGGAPMSGGVSAGVTVIAGESLRWYASLSWGERGFCARCGSSLFRRLKGADANWLVCAGALPSADGLELFRHIYIDDKPTYYDMAGDAERVSGAKYARRKVEAFPD